MSYCFKFDKLDSRNNMSCGKAHKHHHKKGFRKNNRDTRDFETRNGYPNESDSHRAWKDRRVPHVAEDGME